jgi:hypothetical protein
VITRNATGFLYMNTIHCNDPVCSTNTNTSFGIGPSGTEPSVTIGSDGFPIIASHTAVNGGRLNIRRCTNLTCTSSDPLGGNEFATGPVTGPSITIGADGLPIIAYRRAATGDLHVLHCDDIACAPGGDTDTLVRSENDTGHYASITIGTDGLPIISYHDATFTSLLVTHCNDVACTGNDETTTVVDSAGRQHYGAWSSIAIGTDGLPVIAHADFNAGRVRVTHCNDIACTGNDETSTRINGEASTVEGYRSSMTIGANGFPVIAHVRERVGDDLVRDLLVTECNDVACTGQDETTTVVDTAATVGETDITLDADGNTLIGYEDTATQRAKIALGLRRSWTTDNWES